MTAPSLEVHSSSADRAAALRADVRRGFTATPKSLPPNWLYDARGSELFEAITELPEYYPTRTERALLHRFCSEFPGSLGDVEVLIELGSGSSEKTRLLVDALRRRGALHTYVPQDVSPAALSVAMEVIATEFPGLTVHGMLGEFTETLDDLTRRAKAARQTRSADQAQRLLSAGSASTDTGRQRFPAGGRRMIAFLGGTIGNFAPGERAQFLARVHRASAPGEWLLLGVGLISDPDTMVAAYDDAAGITAEFDRNVLRVLNAGLGADFEPDRFAHVATWDADNEWIEMRLQASAPMTVTFPALGLVVGFGVGEYIRTEISAKFRLDQLERELTGSGFTVNGHWTDSRSRFALLLARRR